LGGSLLIGLFLYVVLCLPKVEGLYGVIWGHMGSYDVIWYRSKTDQKNKNNQGFRLPRLAVKSLVDAAKSSTYPSTLEDSSPIGISPVMFLLHHCLSHLLKFTPQFLTLEDWSYWKRAFYCYQCDFFWGCFDCFLGCMVLSSRQGAQRGGSVGNPGLLAISGASFWAVAFQWGRNAEIGMGYFEWSHPLFILEVWTWSLRTCFCLVNLMFSRISRGHAC
jgi:hypothetical protein